MVMKTLDEQSLQLSLQTLKSWCVSAHSSAAWHAATFIFTKRKLLLLKLVEGGHDVAICRAFASQATVMALI